MNWLDIFIIVALIVPTLICLKRGLVKTVLPLVGIIVGIYLAGRFYGAVESRLFPWLDSPNQAHIAAFAIIFVAVIIATALFSSMISSFLRLVFLGWVDRLGGAVFGLAIGVLIPSLLLAAITKFQFPGMEDAVRNSNLAAFFLDRFPLILALLPQEFDAVRQFFG